MYNKYEQKITDLNDVSFWPVDGILFQEHPFSSSSNNHLIWQRFSFPLYLYSITEMS